MSGCSSASISPPGRSLRAKEAMDPSLLRSTWNMAVGFQVVPGELYAIRFSNDVSTGFAKADAKKVMKLRIFRRRHRLMHWAPPLQ